MKRLITIFGTLYIVALSLCAQSDFEAANAAYAEGRYAEAAAGYEAMLAEGPNATLYYNLGNAQFKRGELAQAILAYERALRLKPDYKDAQYNLDFARTRITDNTAETDFVLSTWVRSVRNSLSERTWAILSITLFLLTITGVMVFLLCRVVWMRKTAFHTAWIALIFCAIAGLNARSLHQRNALRNEAIITQGVVNAKSSPDRSGTDLFTIHEGTKVTIREVLGEWTNVRVGKNEGWIRLACLERI